MRKVLVFYVSVQDILMENMACHSYNSAQACGYHSMYFRLRAVFLLHKTMDIGDMASIRKLDTTVAIDPDHKNVVAFLYSDIRAK